MRYLPLVLLLAACSPNWRTHEPKLSAPVDRSRFEADLGECKDGWLNPPVTERDRVAGMFGLLGGIANAADKGEDIFASANTVIDRCMARKGYPVLEEGAE